MYKWVLLVYVLLCCCFDCENFYYLLWELWWNLVCLVFFEVCEIDFSVTVRVSVRVSSVSDDF